MTVHGRTVKQRYIGPSNWNFLARVKRHVGSHTILGSGDLFTSAAVRRMMDETGVDGVTVARGAIGNPFIFRECGALLNGLPISPPSVAEQREAIEFQLRRNSETPRCRTCRQSLPEIRNLLRQPAPDAG